jgi:hypothetical protein
MTSMRGSKEIIKFLKPKIDLSWDIKRIYKNEARFIELDNNTYEKSVLV